MSNLTFANHYGDCESDAYKASTNEKAPCTIRAVGAVLGISFEAAKARLESIGKRPNVGFRLGAHLDELGLQQRPDLSCRSLGKVLPELGSGRFIVRVRHHVFAVIDGQIHERYFLRERLSERTRVKMVYELPGAGVPGCFFQGRIIPEREAYPSNEEWGTFAWTVVRLEDAKERFNRLVDASQDSEI